MDKKKKSHNSSNSSKSGKVVELDDKEILKPTNETRPHRVLILPNKMKVVLVSDPDTDKSAASLDVNIGSLADPWARQGLAHFLEHALFIGSKKYPEMNSFKNYIVQNGGRTNAFTSLTDTVYFFDVAPNALEGAIDRFAQFFLEPLFSHDQIEEELQSVHFEFENSIGVNATRFFRLRKLCGDPENDFAKFEIGNKDSLKPDRTCLDLMIEFYQKWYSGNIMGLSVLGRESLDNLEKMVVPLFERVSNFNVKPYRNESHPFSYDYCRKCCSIIPFRETRKMTLFFPIEDITADKTKTDALAYFTFLLAHEGPNSLLSELKEKGYCTSICCSTYYYSGFGFLEIDVDLIQGITCNNQIIALIAQYIKFLKVSPPEKYVYDEIRTMRKIKFENLEKSDPSFYVRALCKSVIVNPTSRIIAGSILMGDYNHDAIVDVISQISIDLMNIQVISPIFSKCSNLITDPLYGSKYLLENIPKKLIDDWTHCQPNPIFQLPERNKFIPTNFNAKTSAGSTVNVPDVVLNEETLKVWHLQDNKFKVPKAFYGLLFKSNLGCSSPINNNIIGIYCRLFYDYTNILFYSADLAGISYSFGASIFGLTLTVCGFNDKLDLFIYDFVEQLLKYKIEKNRFFIFSDLYLNTLETHQSMSIASLLYCNLSHILVQSCWSKEELIKAMPEVNIDNTAALIREMLSHCQIEALVHGNVIRSEGINVCKKVRDMIDQAYKLHPINPILLLDSHRDVRLPESGICEYLTKNDIHENHGLLIYYQVGVEDIYLKARLDLFHQLISSPYFNQIRMKEQLAYVTFVNVRCSSCGTVGLTILIQSAYDIGYLESRIETFMSSIEKHIESLPSKEYEAERNALITRLSVKPKSLFSYSGDLWGAISSHEHIFDKEDRLISMLKRMTDKSIMSSFYKTYFCEGTSKCRKLVIGIKSKKCKTTGPKDSNNNNNSKIEGKSSKANKSIEMSYKSNKSRNKSPTKSRGDTSIYKSQQNKTSSKSSSSKSSKNKERTKITNIRKFKCGNCLNQVSKMILDSF